NFLSLAKIAKLREGSMRIKKFHADPKSYAPFVALRYNAKKGTKLFGLVNKALCVRATQPYQVDYLNLKIISPLDNFLLIF
ncbi:hypothetical protein MNBD_GAMMA10-834, partial [hydrothermal vent metagenome]